MRLHAHHISRFIGRHARIVVTMFGMLFQHAAIAAGGTGEYPLEWNGHGEKLMYHACGCADNCWVAEVRRIKGKSISARLSCDCDKLYFHQPGHGPEKMIENNCRRFNESDDKAAAMRMEIERRLKEIDHAK